MTEVANLVTPETIYAWHRKLVAMKFAPKVRDQSAAHTRREERNALITKVATENTSWGYGRLQGVMQSLGWHKRSGKTIRSRHDGDQSTGLGGKVVQADKKSNNDPKWRVFTLRWRCAACPV